MEYNYKNQRTSIESLGIKRYFIYDLMGNLIGEYNDQRQSISEYTYAGLWRLFRMDGLPGGSGGVGGCGGACGVIGVGTLKSTYLSASIILIPGFMIIFLGYRKKPIQMIILASTLLCGLGVSVFITDKAYAQSGLDEVDYYYHNDHLMTPMFMTDKNGTVVWTMTQTPFDTLEVNEDPDGDGNFVTNPFRFPGQYADSETNEMLWYNWNRYYIPSLGRYASIDPLFRLKNGNYYSYSDQNPITLFDFDGEQILYGCASLQTYWALRRASELTNEGQHNGPGDALRHCLGICWIARNCNRETALGGGAGHEAHGVVRGQPLDETAMDLWNNKQGLDCADQLKEKCPNYNNQKGIHCEDVDCTTCCRSKLSKGKLKTLPRSRWN